MNTYNNNHFNFRQGSSLLVISIMLIELVYFLIQDPSTMELPNISRLENNEDNYSYISLNIDHSYNETSSTVSAPTIGSDEASDTESNSGTITSGSSESVTESDTIRNRDSFMDRPLPELIFTSDKEIQVNSEFSPLQKSTRDASVQTDPIVYSPSTSTSNNVRYIVLPITEDDSFFSRGNPSTVDETTVQRALSRPHVQIEVNDDRTLHYIKDQEGQLYEVIPQSAAIKSTASMSSVPPIQIESPTASASISASMSSVPSIQVQSSTIIIVPSYCYK